MTRTGTRVASLRTLIVLIGGCVIAASGMAPAGVAGQSMTAASPGRVELRLQPDEAEAALAILDLRARGAAVPEDAWARLFAAEGYTRMMARERNIDRRMGLHRGFTDEKYRAYFATDTVLLSRRDDLHATLDDWKRVDIQRAGRKALAYLPAGTRIRATIYPLLRQAKNSFVFELGGQNPAIFMYMAPGKTAVELENTLAHELHHVGTASACGAPPKTNDARAMALYDWLGGFGEGIAMLAAAGSPGADPLSDGTPELRHAWAVRQDSLAADMAALGSFFHAIIDGKLTGGALSRTGISFINRKNFPQGPFYTVGWFMAATVERELGRAEVVDAVCEPGKLLVAYNRAAAAVNARRAAGDRLPVWPEALLEALTRTEQNAVRPWSARNEAR